MVIFVATVLVFGQESKHSSDVEVIGNLLTPEALKTFLRQNNRKILLHPELLNEWNFGSIPVLG